MITTGSLTPILSFVCSLNLEVNSWIGTQCCESAGQTGGAGFACPQLIWSFMYPLIAFLGAILYKIKI